MTPFYLGFKDEAEATSVLYTTTLEVTDENGVIVQEGSVTPNFANIDTIGTIYRPAPDLSLDPLADSYVPVPYDGWYVNVLVLDSEDGTSLTPYMVDPKPFPMRVWA